MNTSFLGLAVATVLTACGIETYTSKSFTYRRVVATVLTACGIETKLPCVNIEANRMSCNSTYRLRY